MSQRISILGSTGSVGRNTLAVLELHPKLFQVEALTANSNVELLFEQCCRYQPKTAVMASESAAQQLATKLSDQGFGHIEIQAGEQAIVDVACAESSHSVMAAIVGAAGLVPTLEAVKAGKRVLVANKEPLVMTGALFMQQAELSGATLLPIDSEHNAIFQCLPDNQNKADVAKLHLTASGGPFRGRYWQSLKDITPAQACAHPNWSMGRKISVDSATMMNKGLELIEASALFGLAAERVEIVVHPQSIIHSMVEYLDGSFLAQLGAPDMRIPIAHALSWPERIASGAQRLNLFEVARLDFEVPDMANLPCLALARQAAVAQGSAPAVLNAANEVAVDAFLREKIRFTDMPIMIETALEHLGEREFTSIDEVLQIDNEARQLAAAQIDSLP